MRTNSISSGFTFIELLVYIGLFSMLFVSVTSVWFLTAQSEASFETLARIQEAGVFLSEKINADVEYQHIPDYSVAESTIAHQAWYTISPPKLFLESTSSVLSLGALATSSAIYRLEISFLNNWTLEYYEHQNQ